MRTAGVPGQWQSAVRRARGPVGISLAAGFWAQAVLAVTGTVAARLLGPEDRGHLALLLLLPPTLSQLGTLGVPLALTFFVARNESHARPLFRAAMPLAVAQTLAILLLNAAVIVALMATGRHDLVPAAVLGLLSLPGWVAFLYGLAVLQGRQLFVPYNICRMLPVSLFLVVIVVAAFAPGDRLFAVTAAWVVAHSLAGYITAWLGVRAIPRTPPDGEVPPRGEVLRFGLRSLMGSISPLDTLRIDQALVGFILGAQGVGLYVVALAFTNLPRFIAQSIGQVAYPRVAAARARGGSGRAVAARLLLMSLILMLPLAVLLFLSANVLVRAFFGDAFEPAITPMRLLLGAALCMSVRRVVAECARGAGAGGLDSLAEGILWLVFLPTSFLLGNRYGLDGIATALLVSTAASLASLSVLAGARFRGEPAPHRSGNTLPDGAVGERVGP